MNQQTVIAELLRVSELLQSRSVSQSDFEQYGNIGVTTVRGTFGTWNQAIEAAGLLPNPPSKLARARPKHTDEEYLQELIRLTREIGRKPTLSELSAKGNYSIRPYIARWGTLTIACETAYAMYGNPLIEDNSA